MPEFKVENAGSGRNITVTLDEFANPMTAKSTSRAFFTATHARLGRLPPYVNQQVDLEWVKNGDKWLLNGYTAYLDGKPIDASASVRASRPVP
jgi:hypothetical protein